MADVIPLQPATGALTKIYRSALFPPIDVYSTLVPLDALPALEREIEASLKPAQPREVSIAVAALGASTKIPATIEDPEQFGKAMEFDLAALEYPADILRDAVEYARRTLDWYPSIKEMVAICHELIEPRRRQRLAISQMKAEHARRQEEAAAQAAKAARTAERVQWLREVEERARERLGEAAPLPGDVALADSTSQLPSRGPWLPALDRGEEWAAKFCRLTALAARIRDAMREGRARWDEGLALAKRLDTDEAGVRESIGAIEQRLPGPSEVPTEGFWRQIWRVHRACGCEVPCGIFPEETAAALAQSSAQREGLPQMPLDQWSRERRGADAVAAIVNRWLDQEPTAQEEQ
jgi:hypothetical protein